jgi:hypothetical protein
MVGRKAQKTMGATVGTELGLDGREIGLSNE